MQAKLHEKAKALGLDDAAYARMLIYADVNGMGGYASGQSSSAVNAVPSRFRGSNPSPAHRVAPVADELPIEELVDADEPRAEDMEMPADSDGEAALDELLSAGPSLLDDMIARAGAVPAAQPGRQLATRGPRNYRQAPVAAPYGRPGSLTRPVGVNEMAVGSNSFGGGNTGNVLRDNMSHFGIVGTRARG